MNPILQPIRSVFQKIASVFKDDFKPVILKETLFFDEIPLDKMFERKAPLVVEFGVGKGQFIRTYALKYPQKNFFGVEKVNKWVKHTARRVEKAKLTNVKLVRNDATELLKSFAPGAVSEFYILFPDPWPKRRHNFRRLIQTDLISRIHTCLENNGVLYIATDHTEYYEWMLNIVAPFIDKQFKTITDGKSEFFSNYQVKYEKAGRKTNVIHLKKISS